jgi:hypothetical protein
MPPKICMAPSHTSTAARDAKVFAMRAARSAFDGARESTAQVAYHVALRVASMSTSPSAAMS